MKTLMKADAIAEAATGVVAIAAPEALSRLLLGAELSAAGILVVRCFGLAIVGIAFACWPEGPSSAPSRPAWRGLLVYNALIAVYLAVAGSTGSPKGVLFWPVAALHAAVAILLVSAGGTRAAG